MKLLLSTSNLKRGRRRRRRIHVENWNCGSGFLSGPIMYERKTGLKGEKEEEEEEEAYLSSLSLPE